MTGLGIEKKVLNGIDGFVLASQVQGIAELARRRQILFQRVCDNSMMPRQPGTSVRIDLGLNLARKGATGHQRRYQAIGVGTQSIQPARQSCQEFEHRRLDAHDRSDARTCWWNPGLQVIGQVDVIERAIDRPVGPMHKAAI